MPNVVDIISLSKEDNYTKLVAFLDKLEELIDLELLEKGLDRKD
jgi:hypothetical protein